MKRGIILLLLIACTYNPAAVRYVIDGDTFVLNNGEIIRLQGIDTPEQGDINYDRAAYVLQSKIIGRNLQMEGTTDDMFGRKLRFVFVNGKNINEEMVREGWARAYLNQGTKYEQQLERAQALAMQEKKGIWNVDDTSHRRMTHRCVQLGCPEGTIAVSSKQGEVYYNCACSAANLITKENLQCYKSLEEALIHGTRDARRC